MFEFVYKGYGYVHVLAKRLLSHNRLFAGRLLPLYFARGCSLDDAIQLWPNFIAGSLIPEGMDFGGTHYAGYIAENKEWCLPSWIWTNAAIVRMYCQMGDVDKAKQIGAKIASYQQDSGGWIVRNDYDAKGAIPMLAPNDSAYIANNAFIPLYSQTGDDKYLVIAKHCADWIIETARPDGLVHTGYNIRDKKWDSENVIVDTGFTAGLFASLFELTGDNRYRVFLSRFVNRYIELFYISNKNGFCTSIGKQNQHQGGMFARGQAWALEGLIPAYRVLKDERIKTVINDTVDNLLKQQLSNGGWPYNLTRVLMGEDCKAVSVIAKDMMDWYGVTKDKRIIESAKKALKWCSDHTVVEGEAAGGIFSYSVEGGIVKDLYTSCAFVYASTYAMELKTMLERCRV